MFRRLFALIAVLLTIPLAACGSSSSPAASTDSLTVAHAQGSTEVPRDPARVVVMDYSVLDSMNALGLSGKVVGAPTATLPGFLKETFSGVQNVGTMQEPDLEKLAALEPDLILIGGRTAPKYAELSKVAPTLDLSVDATKFLASLQERSLALGDIFNRREQAQAKLDAIDTAVAETKTLAAQAGTGLVLMTNGGKVAAFGPGSRFGLVHDVLGVTPAAKDLSSDTHGQAVSFEFIAKANPARLFVVDRDAAIGQKGTAAKEVLDNALVNRTTAAKNGHITYLDGTRWYLAGSGLDNTVAMIDEVKAGLA